MDRVAQRTCPERFELRLSVEQRKKLGWLMVRLNRSGNALMREALERMHREEQRVMLIQAGFPEGRVP